MKHTLLVLISSFLLPKVAYCQTDTLNAPAPILPGLYADPHIAVFGKKFYMYPTTDGFDE